MHIIRRIHLSLLFFSLPSGDVLKNLDRTAIRHPRSRARIKKVELKNRSPPSERRVSFPSVRSCVRRPGLPRVILGIGRALCALFRARKRFVIYASVVCVGGVCALLACPSSTRVSLHYARRMISRDTATRPGVLGPKLLQHPEIPRFLLRLLSMNNGRPHYEARFSTATVLLSLNEGTLSPTAHNVPTGDRNLVCGTIFGETVFLCLIK